MLLTRKPRCAAAIVNASRGLGLIFRGIGPIANRGVSRFVGSTQYTIDAISRFTYSYPTRDPMTRSTLE